MAPDGGGVITTERRAHGVVTCLHLARGGFWQSPHAACLQTHLASWQKKHVITTMMLLLHMPQWSRSVHWWLGTMSQLLASKLATLACTAALSAQAVLPCRKASIQSWLLEHQQRFVSFADVGVVL